MLTVRFWPKADTATEKGVACCVYGNVRFRPTVESGDPMAAEPFNVAQTSDLQSWAMAGGA